METVLLLAKVKGEGDREGVLGDQEKEGKVEIWK